MAINVKFLNGDIVVPNLAAKKAKKLRRSWVFEFREWHFVPEVVLEIWLLEY
jgi:hypothetical protein